MIEKCKICGELNKVEYGATFCKMCEPFDRGINVSEHLIISLLNRIEKLEEKVDE